MQDLRVSVLGKKGSLTEILKGMKDVSAEMRPIIGKVSFEAEKLVENFKAFNETIQKAKPATAKGTYVTNLTITTTQGVGIKVDVNSL
ncbi:hypothetical protein [Streptococcus pneumoniae]|uniref:hypothetical protein n=1 Tax=Streptococcus pneumoniae TaxID=1313 RepID=UPI001CD8D708|nr:hypothetical protein [Streptococcus pneumoniae]